MKLRNAKIADLGKIVTGKTPSTKDKENFNGRIPFITPVDMTYNRSVFSTERYISSKGAETVKGCILPPQTVCVSCIGSDMGKAVITTETSVTNQQINSIIVDPVHNYLYVYYLMRTLETTIKSLGKNGTAVPILSKSKFSDIEICVHDFNSQCRIAKILSTYDDLIENNHKQIKLLEEVAQRLYKEWFVDLRFPGYENTPIIDGVPQGWKKTTLSKVAQLCAGGDKPKAFSKTKDKSHIVPVYANGIENEGLYGYTDEAAITDDSITISARGNVGYTCLRRTPFFPIVRLITVVPPNECVEYLYFYLKDKTFKSNGAAQQQITVPMIKDEEIILPFNNLLFAFKEKVSPIFDMIDHIKNQKELCEEARDRLLPKLMSGELEV